MPKLPPPIHHLLKPIGEAFIPAGSERHIVKDHFHRRRDSPIFTVRPAFKDHFFGKIETPAPETRLGRYRLLQRSAAIPIINQLGGPSGVKTTIAGISALVLCEIGKPGVLQTDGSANLFFVPDKLWQLRAVTLVWVDGGWTVDCADVSDPALWEPGHQIFSPLDEPADANAPAV